jgi:endonuclease/exonuclease/phosphatase family metal-dependent hydrolase
MVVLGPIMGFVLSGHGSGGGVEGQQLRILTCNTLGSELDILAMERLLKEFGPDVVAFQEWSDSHQAALFGDRTGGRWYVASQGGLCLASRYPIESAELYDMWRLGGSGELLHGRIATPKGIISVFCIHLETARSGLEAVRYRLLDGIRTLQSHLEARRRQALLAERYIRPFPHPRIIAGDFNMPTESQIFRVVWRDYRDAFGTSGWGYGMTRWTRWHGIRIDHVLTDSEWVVRKCEVGPDVGSDHLPLLVEAILPDRR